MPERNIRVMSVMAHQDDFEFNAGGTFALLRRRHGNRVALRVLATTRGASGHHRLPLEDTFFRRREEARRSAALIGAEYECLRGLDGHHLPGQVFIDANTLGGLWNSIRAFRPDYIFCPPVIGDPLAGIHIDHYNTAVAVRMVAYQLCVPHAYPTLDTPPLNDHYPLPLIINVDDPYAREADAYHVRLGISSVYETKVAMARCHESQIFEWLPFSGGRANGLSEAEWLKVFKSRHDNVARLYGLPEAAPAEFFRFTRWGRKQVTQTDLDLLFPDGTAHPDFLKTHGLAAVPDQTT